MVPISQRVRCDAVLGEVHFAFVQVELVRAVLENAEAIRHLRSGPADADVEAELAHAVGDEIFDQQDALVRFEDAFDLLRAAVALGLLTDVDHRLAELLRYERGVGNARGLAAGDDVDLVAADRRVGLPRHLDNDRLALLGKRQQAAAIDIDGRDAAGDEHERPLLIKGDRARLQQYFADPMSDIAHRKTSGGILIAYNTALALC